ncbi:hypothetical protein CYMTET_6496 [Cymbomonas tetramitiformis]|uniref:Uncharacterized protein n=1 Tax=Cymbomonas tetramitiformis TaxID=36881 RepID=A0AAE0GXB4_9CHLO|nr:hypothetical protein CYMTET_6496 [Cymbomonas tetramitiformis]
MERDPRSEQGPGSLPRSPTFRGRSVQENVSDSSERPSCMPNRVKIEDGVLKALADRTWSGIEFGEPPRCKYSFLQYIDALRLGDLELFKRIQEEDKDWWFSTLDRGYGAALHFAVDHGQLHCVKYLLEELGAEVNQRDRARGWTPLHRCAHMAHVTEKPYLEIFEYLLQQGADANIVTDEGWEDPTKWGCLVGMPLSVYDVCVDKGRGWLPGEVRCELQAGYVDDGS